MIVVVCSTKYKIIIYSESLSHCIKVLSFFQSRGGNHKVVSLPKTTIEVFKDSKICKLVIISCFISCLISISSFSSKNLFAQENSDCMECHADPAEVDTKVRVDHVTGEVEIVTMVVDEKEYHASAHGGEDFYCIDCHADLEDSEGEHYPNL
nr:hypothetical protein [Candidatus Brocadiales bacterium]